MVSIVLSNICLFVQESLAVLEIVQDALNGTVCVFWCKRRKTNIAESNISHISIIIEWHFHLLQVVLKIEYLRMEIWECEHVEPAYGNMKVWNYEIMK